MLLPSACFSKIMIMEEMQNMSVSNGVEPNWH